MEQHTKELRAYFFQNMYLQGIHAGIQSQHTTAEMFLKYNYQPGPGAMLYDWAHNHKTTIVLNGGYASNLERLALMLTSKDNPYPWAFFKESEEALNGCITNVGIILPEKVFGLKKRLDDMNERQRHTMARVRIERAYDGMTDFDKELAKEVAACRLMT